MKTDTVMQQTAEFIAQWHCTKPQTDPHYHEEELYRTSQGKWLLYYRYNKLVSWGTNSAVCNRDHVISSLTDEEAYCWCITHNVRQERIYRYFSATKYE